MLNNTKLILVAFGLTSLVGCMRMPGGISASTSPIDGKAYTILGEAFGSATQYHILGIIPIGDGVLLQDAVNNAKLKTGADALIEVTADEYIKNFIVFSTTTTEVRGKAIKFTTSMKES